MNYIRVKTNLSEACIEDRLQYHPEIVEFHLEHHDLEQETHLIRQIRRLQQQGIEVVLHHPPRTPSGDFLDILSENEATKTYYKASCEQLGRICRAEHVFCVIHPHYARTESSRFLSYEAGMVMRERIGEMLELDGAEYFLWENTIEGLFSNANPYFIMGIVEPLRLPLAVDISHSFISLQGDNKRLLEAMTAMQPYAKYFHVVDSKGMTHDSLPLGEGTIDWKKVAPFVRHRPFIFEIGLQEPHTNCTPMIESARFFQNLLQKAEEKK